MTRPANYAVGLALAHLTPRGAIPTMGQLDRSGAVLAGLSLEEARSDDLSLHQHESRHFTDVPVEFTLHVMAVGCT